VLSRGAMAKGSTVCLLLAIGAGLSISSAQKDSIQDPLAIQDKKRRGFEEIPPPPPPPEQRIRLVEEWRIPLGSPLSGPLLALEDKVVAAVESGMVQAFSAVDGRFLWRQDLAEKPAGGPVQVSGSVVQVTVSGKVVSLQGDTGAARWTAQTGGAISGQPTATGDGLLVPLTAGKIVALDAEGRERFRVDLRGAPSTPVQACRGLILAGTEAGTVEAFDRQTGRRLWISETGSAVRSPLLCFRGSIYFGTEDNRLRALRYSGRRRWNYKVGGLIRALPFGLERRVYFLSYDNYVYALKAGSGHLVLRVRMSHRLADDALGIGDKLFLSPYTSGRLMALSLPDLQLLGEYRLDLEGEWFTTQPVRAGQKLLVGYGRYEGRILALRQEKETEPPASR
jgi:outer membrane protein assembly factor BamB